MAWQAWQAWHSSARTGEAGEARLGGSHSRYGRQGEDRTGQDGMAGVDWERKGVARQDKAGMVLQVLASFDSAGLLWIGGERQARIGRQVMYR